MTRCEWESGCDADPELSAWLRGAAARAYCLPHAEALVARHERQLELRWLDAPEGVGVVEQYCHLSVTAMAEDHDFDPDVLSARIGLPATRVVRRDSVKQPGNRVHRYSMWDLELPRRLDVDTELVVKELLALVEPFGTELRSACRELQLEAEVRVAQYLHSYEQPGQDGAVDLAVTMPALAFDVTTLRRLAELGVALDIDQYL